MSIYADSMIKNYILMLVILSFAILSYSSAAIVGKASIIAPAVILSNNTGSLTNISVVITNGNGHVNVTGPQIVGSSTTQSAYTAAMYASNFTGHDFSNYNFTYEILDAGDNVSGPSAGAAMAILAVSAFENKTIRTDFTMTGTISSNGSIGEIGGVYDKVSAAKGAGKKFVLVPKVAPTDPEDELYLLVQTNFGVPLIQVGNISQAAHFVFNDSFEGQTNATTYNFYTNYNVNQLPAATLNCSGECNASIFNQLLNATINLTRNNINSLNSNPKFANISEQLGMVLNESIAVSQHGYLYTGADLAFLDYVNSFYFSGYPSNRASALAELNNIQTFCASLTPPPLTTTNYDYVLSAELRQYWGNFTSSGAISSYNSSQIESDEILDELYLGAQSNGWCTAANIVYNKANVPGTYVETSSALRAVASNRIARAAPYGTDLYLSTSQQAYKQGNYAVAILDADYAFVLSNSSFKYALSTGELDNLSTPIAQNSTYSIWASQFAKESQFYVSESQLTNNATQAKTFAESGYTAALLAQQLSNDTKIINENLVVTSTPQYTTTISSSPSVANLMNYVTFSTEIIFSLLFVVIVLLIANIVLIIIVIHKIKPEAKSNKRQNKRNK
jgi:predicted S18 family serine protease